MLLIFIEKVPMFILTIVRIFVSYNKLYSLILNFELMCSTVLSVTRKYSHKINNISNVVNNLCKVDKNRLNGIWWWDVQYAFV